MASKRYGDDSSRLWSGVQSRFEGCWEWQHALRNGYGTLKWRGKDGYAHRAAYEDTFGAIPDGIEVCHECDNPKCCRPAHLFLGTHENNMRDMASKGRSKSGTPRSTIGADSLDMFELRYFYEQGASLRQTARAFGASRPDVTKIFNGWQPITESV